MILLVFVTISFLLFMDCLPLGTKHFQKQHLNDKKNCSHRLNEKNELGLSCDLDAH